jgi:glucokinase
MEPRAPRRREYIREGCFEHHASGRGLDRAASRALGNAKTAADVFAACRRGERIGKTLLANAIECWGMAVANVVSLFNPEIIILGGGVFGPAAEFLPRIRAEAEKWAQPVAMKRTRVRVSKLGPDAGLLGAGYFAVKATHGKTK